MSIRQLNKRFPGVFKYESGDFYTAGSYGGIDDEYYITEIIGLGDEHYDRDYLGKHKFTAKDEAKLIKYFKNDYSNKPTSWAEAKKRVEEEICIMHSCGDIDYWSPERLKQYQERQGY